MKVYLLFLLCYLSNVGAVIYQLNASQYEQMPPIVNLEPFKSCIRTPGGKYCSGRVAYVADEQTPLLTMMQEYSEQTATHYNHTKAFIGLCVSQCKEYHRDAKEHGLERTFEACLNRSLSKQYNLKAKLETDLVCHEHGEPGYQASYTDILVAVIMITIIILNVIGSILDVRFPALHEFYGARYFLYFSIPQNYKKLMAPTPSEPRFAALNGLHGARSIITIGVLSSHSLLLIACICADPKFVEDSYDMPILHTMFNGTLVMQSFFLLAGMLQIYSMLVYTETNTLSLKSLPALFIKRFLRLTPPFVVILAAVATWMPHAYSGPAWDVMVVEESIDCRRHWFLHLLYINNYIDNSNKCMPHSWFLSANIQLFYLGCLVFFICKNIRTRKIVLSVLFIAGMIIPAVQTYVLDLDGMVIASPKQIMELFLNDKTFHVLHRRAHSSVSSYVMGMACGYLIYHLQRINFDLTRYKKWRIIFWIAVPLQFFLPAFFKSLYEEGPRTHIFYRMLLAAFVKPLYAALSALIMFGLIFKIETVYRGIFEWFGWTVLSRLSYSAFLVHGVVVRVSGGVLEQPLQPTYALGALINVYVVATSFAMALVYWLAVEAPLARLCGGPNGRKLKEMDVVNVSVKKSE